MERSVSCVDGNTYQVVVDVFGLNGTWTPVDNTGSGATFVTNPNPLTFTNNAGNSPGVTTGTVTATYPIGTNYNFDINKTAGADPYFGEVCDANIMGTAPDLPTCSIDATSGEECDGTLGTVTFTITGGTPDINGEYAYVIYNDNNAPVATGNSDGTSVTETGLAAGDYTLVITDDINCSKTCNFTIDEAVGCCNLTVVDCPDPETILSCTSQTDINKAFTNMDK